MKSSSKLTFETILVSAALLALIAAPLAARACPPKHDPAAAFAEFDADGDGALSQAEFDAGRAAHHAQMAEEGHGMKGMEMAPSFADFDGDGDGSLTSEEFMAGHQTHMQAMRDERHGKMHGQGKHKSHHGGGHGEMQGQHAGGKAHASFGDIDTDGDGCISEAELDAHHAEEAATE